MKSVIIEGGNEAKGAYVQVCMHVVELCVFSAFSTGGTSILMVRASRI
jgi:hypothetical protein